MNKIHEPDPRFLERLEWQLTSDRRRRQAFGGPKEYSPIRRKLMMISVALCSVLTGVVATATTAHLEAVSHRQLLLTQAETRIQLADSRIQHTRQILDAARQRISLGLIPHAKGDRIADEVSRLEIEKQRLELDRDEIRLSNKLPQNDLSAPVIGGRDFVTARLQMAMKSLQTAAAGVRAEADEARRLMDKALIGPRDMDSVNEEMNRIRLEMDGVNRKIELRAGFLRGEIAAEKVDLMALAAEKEKQVKAAQDAADRIREDMTDMEKKYQAGLISIEKVEAARFALESAEADRKLAELELQILQLNLRK